MENELTETQKTNEQKSPVKTRFVNGLKAFGGWCVKFFKLNYLMFAYIVAATLIELTGIAVTAGRFYMTEPWIFLTFLALVCIVSQYLPGHKSRFALFMTALLLNFVLDLIFIVIYDSTGGTVFDFAMINLRKDAMMIVETIPFSFTYVFVSCLTLALYGSLGFILTRRMPKPEVNRYTLATTASLTALVFCINVMVSYITNAKNDTNDLSYMLHQTETATYSNKGIIGNFYNELVRGLWFSEIDVGDEYELESFIYAKSTDNTPFTGRAEGYNVVTVLCESFEWFTFLFDAEKYPNGYAKALDIDPDVPTTPADEPIITPTEEEIIANLRVLFPNLYRFYEDNATVILNNSHSLEKTDISENKTIIGNYPLYEYINYTYPENSIPYSLPNVMKNLFGVESNSFHDGYRAFYNREVHHVNALGFNSFTAAEDMDIEDDDTGLGERNLDSMMIEACKTEMFPADRRFNTFITTITQHGQYAYRENLEPYYDKLDELGILPFEDGASDANALRFYCAAGMEFDKAIGVMLDYLENTDCLDENGNPVLDENDNPVKLADRTLITLFGDHNCYYQGISNYVKDIYSTEHEDYCQLYRVPVMIKIGNQTVDENYRIINKFTCVTDIYPTILDLLGIRGFSNLMYGVSAFNQEQESILYSRAYSKFLTDKIYFNSLNNILYLADDADDDYIAEIESRADDLLKKISHVNRIFASDFFKGEREQDFYERLRRENQELLT